MRRHQLLFRAGVIGLIVLLIYACGREGLKFRIWVWDTTAPIRFTGDIDRGFDWGRTASNEGMLNQYEKMAVQKPTDGNWLDYAPLRLEVMTLWAKWAAVRFPSVKHWSDQKSYELTAPLLRFTLATEITGAAAAFWLVWAWSRRRVSGRPPVDRAKPATPGYGSIDLDEIPGLRGHGFFRGTVPGLFAAAILWFNPSVILDGYGWPSYDGWVIPFFLLAALAATFDWWFTAGVVIGVGAMLKGQLLGAVPVLAIWGVIAGPAGGAKSGSGAGRWAQGVGRNRWVGIVLAKIEVIPGHLVTALRVVGGAAVAVAIIASPWLLTSIPAQKLAAAREIQLRHHQQAWQVPAMTFAIPRVFNLGVIVWVAGVTVLVSVLPWIGRWSTARPGWHRRVRRVVEHRWFWSVAAGSVAFGWTIWPWFRVSNRSHVWTGILIAGAAAALVLLVRPGRALLQPVVITTAAALLLCMPLFNASSAWWDCGFKFGTEHWRSLEVGPAENAPALLTGRFRWDNNKLDEPAATLPAKKVLWVLPRQDHVLSISQLLRLIAGVGIVIAAIGLGFQARRRDPRVLIALVSPWVWFYCFTPQVHDRYLVFAAAAACVCAGISSGLTLLGIGLSIVAAMSILADMLGASGSGAEKFQSGLGTEFPRLFEKSGPHLRRLLDGSHPDLAWAVLLVGCIFMYYTLAFRHRRFLLQWTPERSPF